MMTDIDFIDKLSIMIFNKPEADVVSTLKTLGMEFRIVRRDEESYIITADYRPQRLNLTFYNGLLTKTTRG